MVQYVSCGKLESIMRLKFLYFSAAILLTASIHCAPDGNSNTSSWVSPETDKSINLGDKITLQIKPVGDGKVDSIVYFIDTVRMASSVNASAISVNSDSLPLGNRALTAKVYKAGKAEEITAYLTIRSALMPKKLTYSVVSTYPHDTASYTEGLEYHNGFLYESDGGVNESSLRKTDIKSGKILQLTPIPKIFAEGIVITDEKILQLTYTENIALEYDLNTLKKIREFPVQNPRQGWGLCTDGRNIYNTDGSSTIYILNKDNYVQKGYIEVFDHNGPVEKLNELEYINGQLYANIFTENRVVIINPKNGQITGEIDFSALYPPLRRLKDNPFSDTSNDVLNGIAWDAKGKRLFVTGKKWAKMFQVVVK